MLAFAVSREMIIYSPITRVVHNVALNKSFKTTKIVFTFIGTNKVSDYGLWWFSHLGDRPFGGPQQLDLVLV